MSVPRPGSAGLAMYPFPEVRWAFDAIWAGVAERLPWVPRSLDWDGDVHRSWTDDSLVVAQACGWPLVTALRDRVRVLGTFAATVPQADRHRYRSVVIARRPVAPVELAGAVAAVNSSDSLSGWVSLLAAVHGPGARWEGEVLWTGAHVSSVQAVHEGRADVASIDAVTFALLRRTMPELFGGVHVIGEGPLVPSLPVVTHPAATDAEVDQLRKAFADAVAAAPAAAEAALIRGFVSLDLADYEPLVALGPA